MKFVCVRVSVEEGITNQSGPRNIGGAAGEGEVGGEQERERDRARP